MGFFTFLFCFVVVLQMIVLYAAAGLADKAGISLLVNEHRFHILYISFDYSCKILGAFFIFKELFCFSTAI